MRNKWNHRAPAGTQPQPSDNTTEHVMYQVRVFTNGVPDGRYGINGQPRFVRPLIHPESAMEIAAWWQAPGNAFAVFASTGTIVDGLADEIAAEAGKFTEGRRAVSGNYAALRALEAYVRAVS